MPSFRMAKPDLQSLKPTRRSPGSSRFADECVLMSYSNVQEAIRWRS
jgi:hypothetical protein